MKSGAVTGSLPLRRRVEDRRSGLNPVFSVIPGQEISSGSTAMRGHGTFFHDGNLIASVSGIVERVNMLTSVRPPRYRYLGEIGDVVVGRVTEIGQGRWKVDVNARLDAVLLLSSINLPGGVLRKRTYEDELNMRRFFVENDLLSAEVHSIFHDGSLSLHARSDRYTKLEHGCFIAVPACLIKRCKSHFHTFDFGVSLILGNNGYCWLSPVTETSCDIPEIRSRVARVRNAISLLVSENVAVSPTSIQAVYMASTDMPIKDILLPDRSQSLIEKTRKLMKHMR